MDCISAQFPQIRKAEKLKSKTNIFNSNNISPKKSLEKEQSTVRKQKAKEKFQTVINPQLEKQQQENNLSSQDKFELACPQSLSNLLQNNHKTTKLQRENYILKNLKALSNEDLFFIAHECLVKNPKQRNIFDHQVLKHAFSKIKFFTELIENSGEQHMMNIVKKVQAESFTEKQIVFNQNDSGDKFYIILKGSCGVYIKNNQELEEKQNKSIVNSQECDNISQENYKIQDNIIEQTFLTASASMATICTIEPCEFAVLSKRDYKEIIYSIEEFKQQQELKFLRKLANFEKVSHYTKKIELNTIQQKEVFGDIETLQKIPKRICSVECVSQEGWVYYMKAQDFLKRCDLYIEYQLLKQLILQAKFKQKQQEILVEKRKIAMDPFNEELYNELLKISKEQVDEQKEINQFIKKKQKPLQSQLHNLQETEELENINERKKGKKLLSPEKNPKQNNDISGQNSVDSQNSYSNTFKAQKNFQIQSKSGVTY
ncbi:Cyclic nucleotide-binding protein [Pseudocohnilembus persalinus]|uniref:Cyclic nucleotide-binding protein n=1 Tax=Pseudocohnilembus persalinus TaxID=266149 RepID=A0A0V0R1I5_PSEPJ|nr:Cyclic nucleotide-binding protein [Pseudocohnilembus persalinus]|eukprot:KRX08388.1 Cyclic nucleotide-binding protein [Pseudocohnilembus persalinus]